MCKKLIYLVCFVLVLGLVSSASADLVAHWKFNNDATDSVGSLNWTLGGGAAYSTDAKEGSHSLSLDGIGDRAYQAHPPTGVGPLSAAFSTETVLIWFKADTANGTQVIYEQGGYSNGLAIRINNGNLETAVCPGQVTASTSLSSTDWTHVAVTFDNGLLTLYMNGAEADSATATYTQVAIHNPAAGIGARNNEDAFGGTATGDYFGGLIDDVQIHDNVLSIDEICEFGGISLAKAADPTPTDGATDVVRQVVLSWEPGEFAAPTNGHKVYLGESFDDVNDATGGVAQTAASYTLPQRLDFGTTYYWRVDEVNAPPTSHIEFKGEVWSFTTEPVGYPIAGENITATASSSNSADEGPENTINGSGLDADDLHSAEVRDMWLSSALDTNAAWIQYEFDKVYKLHQMWVWNHNSLLEPAIGFGVKDAAIEYSTDGADWTTLGTTHEFAWGPGVPNYAYNTTVDLGGVAAKYVKITTNSNWGGIVNQYGLSEVRFLYIPLRATEPNPESGATDMDVDNVTLSWKAGREAAEHDVYISTDEQSVIDSNVPVSIVTEAQDGPLSLDLGETYYWKVNEVNIAETPITLEGDIWNFATQDYLIVEDFEAYNDLNPEEPGSNRIFLTWIDGYDNPATNGSVVGYADAPFVEQSIVYGGKQSMPLNYDNSTASYSEATANVADLQVGQDWTKHGIKALTLRFFGDPNNAVQQMYVKLNGSKVAYDSDADNITRTVWQPWNIDLADFTSVNLGNVTELSIGLERSGAAGGKGVVYFDDIRLYTFERELITPTEPNTAGLMAYYEFEGTYNDSSGNNHTGIAMGSPTFVAGKVGQAISLDGRHDYVEIPDYNGVTGIQSRTCCAWIKTTKGNEEILSWGQNVASQKWVFRTHVNGAIRAEVNGGYIVGGSDLRDDRWHHVVAVFETDETPDVTDIRLYVDGVQEAISAELSKAIDTAIDGRVRIGKSPWSSSAYYFEGLIDDVRIYDYALSDGEVAWLAGRTKPFDKPF